MLKIQNVMAILLNFITSYDVTGVIELFEH